MWVEKKEVELNHPSHQELATPKRKKKEREMENLKKTAKGGKGEKKFFWQPGLCWKLHRAPVFVARPPDWLPANLSSLSPPIIGFILILVHLYYYVCS